MSRVWLPLRKPISVLLSSVRVSSRRAAGTKEMLRRIVESSHASRKCRSRSPRCKKSFCRVGQAKVATSAEEARSMNILMPADRIVLNRSIICLAEAKKEVLHMVAAGYKPPAPELIYAAGRDALAASAHRRLDVPGR